MSRRFAIIGLLGPLVQWATVSDERSRTATSPTAPAAFGLLAWQIMTPGVVLGAGNLRVNKSVDSLMGDQVKTILDPAGLFNRFTLAASSLKHKHHDKMEIE